MKAKEKKQKEELKRQSLQRMGTPHFYVNVKVQCLSSFECVVVENKV